MDFKSKGEYLKFKQDIRAGMSKKFKKYIDSIKSVCDGCKKDITGSKPDYYMLTDEVWLSIYPSENGFLCLACAESKLGRPFEKKDLIDCALNRYENPYTEKMFNQ